MEFYTDFDRAMPLLPIDGTVYLPGRTYTIRFDRSQHLSELFEYAKKNNCSKVAVAYVNHEEETEDSQDESCGIEAAEYDELTVPLYSTAVVFDIDKVTGKKLAGGMCSWELHISNGRRASIVKEQENSGLPFRTARLKPFDEINTSMPMSLILFMILPVWTKLRLINGSDCDDCLMPSYGNRYFNSYIRNFHRFIYELYACLPLTFEQRMRFLEAGSLVVKGFLMAEMLPQLKDAGFRPYIETAGYARLCRITPRAAVTAN